MTKQNKPAPLVDGELPHLLDDDGNPLPGNEPKSQVQDDLTTAILRIIDKADEVSRSTTGLADEKYIAHREELIRGFTEFHNNHLQAAEKPDVKNGYRGFIDPIKLINETKQSMVDTEAKARMKFLAILHDPEPTKDAIKSIINQPDDVVDAALQKYAKWRDQNDRLVAYPQLQVAVQNLQKQLSDATDPKLVELIDALKKLLET